MGRPEAFFTPFSIKTLISCLTRDFNVKFLKILKYSWSTRYEDGEGEILTFDVELVEISYPYSIHHHHMHCGKIPSNIVFNLYQKGKFNTLTK